MASIHPVLEGAVAQRATEVLGELSSALLALEPRDIGDPSWASGTSGLAVVHAELANWFPDRTHGERAEAWLLRTVELLEATPSDPSLASGLAGIGWVVGLLTSGHPDGEHGLGAEVEAILLRLMANPGNVQWELFQGISGFAVFARGRHDRRLISAIARRLVESSWHVEPVVNLGMAHGVSGALAVASTLVRDDVHADELRPIVRATSAWLLSQRSSEEGDAWFRACSDDDGEPARTAWCYGDLGVAWSLLLAARALADSNLSEEAFRIAEHAARRPLTKTGVVDAGLCHGAIGVAHVFHRMSALRPDRPKLRRAAREWFARTLEMRVLGARFGGFRSFGLASTRADAKLEWTDDASVLTGAGGIALALSTALGKDFVGWDAPLLVCA
jgi:hypothetical protein